MCLLSLGDDILSELAHSGFDVSAQLVDFRSMGSTPGLSLVVDTPKRVIAKAAVTHKGDSIFCFATDGSSR